MDVIIPEPDIFYSREELLSVKGFQTVYLLHGKGHSSTDWIKNTSVERYAMENQAAVVMPYIEGGKYEDGVTGRYWTYLTKECMEVAEFYFPLSSRKEDRFAAGVEQGGCGVLRWKEGFPEIFGKVMQIRGEQKEVNQKNNWSMWKEWDRELEGMFQMLPFNRNIYHNS